MTLIWLGVLAALVSSGMYLLRAAGIKRYIVEEPPLEAMEYADFTLKPHPIYPRIWLLIVAFSLSIIAAIFVFTNLATPAVIALIAAIIAFFAYDILGSTIMTKMVVMPDKLLFENVKGAKQYFLIEKTDIKKIVPTNSGFYIEVQKPAIGNRLPFRTDHKERILDKVAETTGIQYQT